MNDEKTYGPSCLAKMFGVSVQSIRNWGDRGIIPAPDRTPTGHRKYKKKHLEAINKYLYPQGGGPLNA